MRRPDKHNIDFFYAQGILNSSASVDPDSDGTDGMSFVWYCKDQDDVDFNEKNLSDELLVSEHDIVEIPSGEEAVPVCNNRLFVF